MSEPTAQEIQAAKELARERFGHEEIRLLVVDMPDGSEVSLLVAQHSRKTWAKYFDARARQLLDAVDALYVDHVVWPSSEDCERLANDWAAVRAHVAEALSKWAGDRSGAPEVLPLKASGLPAIRLSAAEAARLLEQNKGQKLWTVRCDGLDEERAVWGCVVRTPPKPIFDAANDARRAAEQRGSGRLASFDQFSAEQVVWSPEPLDSTLVRWPAVIVDVWSALNTAAGAAASTRSKRL
jgi:hypothetical protein